MRTRGPGVKIGEVWGHLTVLGNAGYEGTQRLVSCVCSCGKLKTIRASSLKNGTVSCGCMAGELIRRAHTRHGYTKYKQKARPEYTCWVSIRQRCEVKSGPAYHLYGGRGIRVSDSWQRFENFIADMGPKPSPRHSIDRIDNDGPYSKENCRWADPLTQSNNRRVCIYLQIDGERKTASEWSRISGVNVATIRRRARAGMDAKSAVFTPHAWRGHRGAN